MSYDGFSSMRGFIQDPNNSDLINDQSLLSSNPSSNPTKRKRNLPGNPDPEAIVIALSPKSLMATNRFLCEICNKGFQRDQNLQLHRRGHNLPWKLKKRTNEEVKKKVYICPEKTCVHHDPSKALGDLTGIKKHFSRKHGEKKWKCEKCSKKYAVQSDWKAHSKICGTREYKCDCGTLFSRKDSFITHRAFCDALAGESERFSSIPQPHLSFRNDLLFNNGLNLPPPPSSMSNPHFRQELAGIDPGTGGGQINLDMQKRSRLPLWLDNANINPFGNSGINSSGNFLATSSTSPMSELVQMSQNHWFDRGQQTSSSFSPRVLKEEDNNNNTTMSTTSSLYNNNYNNNNQEIINGGLSLAQMSATALLQKAAQMGSTRSPNNNTSTMFNGFNGLMRSSSPLSNLGGSFNNSRNHEMQHLNNHGDHHGLWFGGDNMGSNSLISNCTTNEASNNSSCMLQSGDHHHHHQQQRNLSTSSRENEGHDGSLTRDFLAMPFSKMA